MRFRFLHGGALRLDSPFEGMRDLSPAVASTLMDASIGAFHALVDVAIDREVDLVLLTGDIYEGPTVGLRAQGVFAAGLEALDERGIHVVVTERDDDHALADYATVDRWPDTLTVLGSAEPTTIEVRRDGHRLATVTGQSRAAREISTELRAPRGPGCHIAMVPAPPEGKPDVLAERGFAYWAVGGGVRDHIHHEGHPWVVDAGLVQARSADGPHAGAKGVLVIAVDDGRVLEPEFVPVDTVRFEAVSVDVTDRVDSADVRAALHAEAELFADVRAERPLVLRATLTGSGPAMAELRRPQAALQLVEALRAESPPIGRILWWDQIDLAPGGPTLIDLREGHDFASELSARLRELEASPARTEALDRWLGEFPAELAALAADPPGESDQWDRAASMAIDLVGGER